MTVLGLAWLRGPCTTYAVMKELSTSASSFYKSRAGTAYSVAKRLVQFELLATAEGEGEGENLIRITPAGVEALQKWLTPPIPLQDITHSADLIRLRFFFLGVVDAETRIKFIDTTLDGLREFLVKCERLMPENEEIGDYFGVLATLSTIYETRGRIQWLLVVRVWVLDPMSANQKWAETVLSKVSEV